MINLLPPEVKDNYHYARLNVGLRRWVLLCLAALIGLGLLATYGLLSLQSSTNTYEQQIASTEKLFQQEDYAGTQQQIQDLSGSLKLAVKVLGQEVLFSQLIKQIAIATPANVNLTGLTINQAQPGVDITAEATNYNAATQLQANLADESNKIFSKADIVNITCSPNATNPRYPCKINIRALFAKDNPFLFINSKAGAP
ncbi:MAG TPA: PilN domain-containing protein [Candidatus Saccharimonadales bacterium]|nr:PilN domain-containing protein [Candidatus Saccharimonadales bacterium]